MEKLECPECDGEMFENRAGGLTCGNKACGRVIFHSSAEETRKLLCIIKTGSSIIKSQEDAIKKYEQIVKLMNERQALLEAKILRR